MSSYDACFGRPRLRFAQACHLSGTDSRHLLVLNPGPMKQLNAFYNVVKQSGLVDDDVLKLALDQHQQTNPGLTAQQFADALVNDKIITSWQREHLVKGKHRGFLVGSYKILRMLGRGGHSSVYLAEHLTLKQQRVIKVLKQTATSRPSSLQQRFVREAQAAARLDHPNVVRCHDIVIDEKLSYIVMEYFPGEDLEKLVRRRGALPVGESINYIIQAAQGLEYCRQAGMIHRDIKPSNLFRTQDKKVKILDLGLAMLERGDEQDASLTQMYNDNLGTADYIAPEQARNSHDVDFRADVYSLGCTLYHLLVGHPPFNQGTIIQRIAKHQTEMPTPIRRLRQDCPKQVEAICWKMIQKDPQQRFQSYRHLIQALNKLLSRPIEDPLGQSSDLAVGAGAHGQQKQLAGAQQSDYQTGEAEAAMGLETLEPIDDFEVPTGIESIDTDPIFQSSLETMSRLPQHPSVASSAVPLSSPVGTVGRPVSANGTAGNHPQRSATATRNGVRRRPLSEEEAYRRFVRRERLKMIWIGVGLLVGIGVSIAATVVINSWGDLNTPPPAAKSTEGVSGETDAKLNGGSNE